jgi:NADP-dependent aldehyde dehydrogenase
MTRAMPADAQTAARGRDTSRADLRRICAAAAEAARVLGEVPAAQRAGWLRAIADAIDGDVDAVTAVAARETSLGAARLTGEVSRTTGQLRLFADVLTEGAYVEAIIDHADADATPPRPDVRRMLHAIGPVAVYAAGNFPFAFSVAGGDTASALAAGCPVVVKAHPGHPGTSAAVAGLVTDALAVAGAPQGAFDCVVGFDAGRDLVGDPAIRAAAFTGSLSGGRALFDLASARPEPIPFYGELGSVNPVLVMPEAGRARATEVADGLVASFTLGVGQFCTKPGVVLAPRGGDLLAALADRVGRADPGAMLNAGIAARFRDGAAALAGTARVETLATARPTDDGTVSPLVLRTDVAGLLGSGDMLLEECFGPVCLVVEYEDDAALARVVAALPGSLTATVHAEPGDLTAVRDLLPRLRASAGRIVWNGWPTGVAVNWAMHHGGPWPSTTASVHTSVGATAIRRFLRPVAYQDLPEALLPPALHDANPLNLVRRVDGRMVTD